MLRPLRKYRVVAPVPEAGALPGDCIVDDPVDGRATLARTIHRDTLAAAIERGDVIPLCPQRQSHPCSCERDPHRPAKPGPRHLQLG